MTYTWLLAVHIVGLGYWLGAELVINSTYRYVCYNHDMPFDARSRLMDHVMHVDQHVRYALVLQASLGTALAVYLGYIPGGDRMVVTVCILGVAWLAFVELVHRLRHRPIGRRFAAIDRGSRYLLMAVLFLVATGLIGGAWNTPDWLRWKLASFACVIACGVGIRLALIGHFKTWAKMERDGPTAETNAIIRQTYIRATSILVLLWVFIGVIAVLSVAKPS